MRFAGLIFLLLAAPAVAAPPMPWDGIARQPRLLDGAQEAWDAAAEMPEAVGSTTAVDIVVGLDGRVDRCRVVTSSGNPDADRFACRVVERRFRYEAAANGRGDLKPMSTLWRFRWR